jgi:hypothetical protein
MNMHNADGENSSTYLLNTLNDIDRSENDNERAQSTSGLDEHIALDEIDAGVEIICKECAASCIFSAIGEVVIAQFQNSQLCSNKK